MPQEPVTSDLTKQYGKGFSMLQKMGFKVGSGLGPSEDGISAPIEIRMRRLGEGIQDDEGLQSQVSDRGRRISKRKKPVPVLPGRQDQNAFDWSGESSDDDSNKPGEEEHPELQVARKQVEQLTNSRKDLQYRIFALSLPGDSTSATIDSLNIIVDDIIEAGILLDRNVDMEVLFKYVDVLRDRYDSDPIWYELDVESLIAAVVSDSIDKFKDKSEVTSDLIQRVREIVIDDDAFTRVLEFRLLPPLALNPDLSLLRTVRDVATPLHYESIFHRLIEPFLIRSLTHNRKECAWLVTDGWVDLVPAGLPLETLLEEYVKPRLTTSNSPVEISSWKPLFTPEAWRDIVKRLAVRISQNLKKLDPSSPQVENIFQVVLEWRKVLSNSVLGFLLFESGFIQRWLEHFKVSPEFSTIFRRWYPLLAQVTYHTPAKRFVLDALRIVRGEAVKPRRRPAGPPPEFFSRARPVSSPQMAEKITLGDVVKDEAARRGLVVQPKQNLRMDGCQVFKIGEKSVYWKDDSVFSLDTIGNWAEVSLDSVFS
jgi:hypothetical protein